MSTSSLITIVYATSTNAQLGLGPGGEYFYVYFELITSIWFATALFICVRLLFSSTLEAIKQIFVSNNL